MQLIGSRWRGCRYSFTCRKVPSWASNYSVKSGSLHEWNLSGASTSFRVVSLATVWKQFGQMELKVSSAYASEEGHSLIFRCRFPSGEIREAPGSIIINLEEGMTHTHGLACVANERQTALDQTAPSRS
jgi:hypothetical protein